MIILKHNNNLRRAVLTLLALIAFAQTTWAQSQFGGGNGTYSSPYLINNVTQWNYFCECLSNGNHFSGIFFK